MLWLFCFFKATIFSACRSPRPAAASILAFARIWIPKLDQSSGFPRSPQQWPEKVVDLGITVSAPPQVIIYLIRQLLTALLSSQESMVHDHRYDSIYIHADQPSWLRRVVNSMVDNSHSYNEHISANHEWGRLLSFTSALPLVERPSTQLKCDQWLRILCRHSSVQIVMPISGSKRSSVLASTKWQLLSGFRVSLLGFCLEFGSADPALGLDQAQCFAISSLTVITTFDFERDPSKSSNKHLNRDWFSPARRCHSWRQAVRRWFLEWSSERTDQRSASGWCPTTDDPWPAQCDDVCASCAAGTTSDRVGRRWTYQDFLKKEWLLGVHESWSSPSVHRAQRERCIASPPLMVPDQQTLFQK